MSISGPYVRPEVPATQAAPDSTYQDALGMRTCDPHQAAWTAPIPKGTRVRRVSSDSDRDSVDTR